MNEQQIHIGKIRKKMIDAGAGAMLITSNANLYYTAGSVVNGYLYIPDEEEPILFLRRPAGQRAEDYGLENMYYVHKPEQITEIIAAHDMPMPSRIMLEEGTMTHAEWLRFEKIFGTAQIMNATPVIQRARSVKTEWEIAQLRQSAELHAKTYSMIPKIYQEISDNNKKTVTDIVLQIQIECLMRYFGNLGIFRIFGESMEIFMGSVLAGKNAAEPSPYDFGLGGKGLHPSIPVGACGSELAAGTTVMVDIGGNFTGYMTDMTRVFSIGKLPENARSAHSVALDIQAEIARMMRPGAVCEDIYNKALAMAANAGLADRFMGVSQQARFVGHGVGIEVNELPVLGARSQTELEPGMVVAVEPKFVIEGVGAVGIENTFLITDNGCEKLTVLDEEIIELS